MHRERNYSSIFCAHLRFAGLDASGVYAQDKRALRGATAVDTTAAAETADGAGAGANAADAQSAGNNDAPKRTSTSNSDTASMRVG